MKFDGSSWVYVGLAGFTPGWAYVEGLAFDSADTPYVAYQEYKASVMKFDGTSWVQVGSAGFVCAFRKTAPVSNSHFDVKRPGLKTDKPALHNRRFRLFPQIIFSAVFQNENCWLENMLIDIFNNPIYTIFYISIAKGTDDSQRTKRDLCS